MKLKNTPSFKAEKEEKIKGIKSLRSKYSTFMTRMLFAGMAMGMFGCIDEKKDGDFKEDITLSTINFENSFPVDKARLKEHQQDSISKKITQFLDRYNSPESFDTLIASDIYVIASSDERPTNSWGEDGNTALTWARITEISDVLTDVIKQYPFHRDIPLHDQMLFKKKSPLYRIPKSEQGSEGVTYISEMINKETGKRYTNEEISKMSNAEKVAHYDEARYVKLDFIVPKGTKIEELKWKNMAEEFSQYPKFTLLVDNSESMNDDMTYMQEIFGKVMNNVAGVDTNGVAYTTKVRSTWGKTSFRTVSLDENELEMIAFCDELYLAEKQKIEKPEDITKFADNNKRSSTDEFPLETMLLSLKLMQPLNSGQTQGLGVLTDEGLQDYTPEILEQIRTISQKKNIDVRFYLLNPDDPQIMDALTLEELDQLIRECAEAAKQSSEDAYYKLQKRIFGPGKKIY